MKKKLLPILYCGITLISGIYTLSYKDSNANTLSSYVDPTIGSAHSRWFFFTPAAVPFGMAKAAPTTYGHLGSRHGWGASGYDYRHISIEGFANFHEFQVGG